MTLAELDALSIDLLEDYHETLADAAATAGLTLDEASAFMIAALMAWAFGIYSGSAERSRQSPCSRVFIQHALVVAREAASVETEIVGGLH